MKDKIRPSFYLKPETMAKFEMYRRTAFVVPVSQTALIEFILDKFFKDNVVCEK